MTERIERRFYSPAETRLQTGLSEPTLWRLRKAKQFPEPVQLSPRRVGYPVGAVEAWIAQRLASVAA